METVSETLKKHWKDAFTIMLLCVIASIPASFVMLKFLPAELVREVSANLLVIGFILNTFIYSIIGTIVGAALFKQARLKGAPIIHLALKGAYVKARGKLVRCIHSGLIFGLVAFIIIFMLDLAFYYAGVRAEGDLCGFTLLDGLALSIYAGLYEEALFRFFLLTLIAWLLKPLKYNSHIANIFSALLFAYGHIPTLYSMGITSTLMILRVVSLNTVAGIIFGYSYISKGYECSVTAHITTDIIVYCLLPMLL
ncbi:hypothetical protein DRO02_03410 [archaeon]|nr:MAG: hypothetical protein DRO21_03705 [archaeon]RLG64858.1 MAG: hypothetical protein DRO02_03410 [archaeon]HDM23322.1 CPBP family intramembrane metalloprotease [Candidatus Bathyarchaeota archaeon]